MLRGILHKLEAEGLAEAAFLSECHKDVDAWHEHAAHMLQVRKIALRPTRLPATDQARNTSDGEQ